MNPYPFELLNHFTVPCTYVLLLMETWMFLLAAESRQKHPPLINCAECTRMRYSVKSAFVGSCVRKYTHIRLQKRFNPGERRILFGGVRFATIRKFKRTQGLLFSFHSLNHLFRSHALARTILRYHWISASRSSPGAGFRKDCYSRRSKDAGWEERRFSGFPRTFPACSRIPDFA
jgi:hypothetical protein